METSSPESSSQEPVRYSVQGRLKTQPAYSTEEDELIIALKEREVSWDEISRQLNSQFWNDQAVRTGKYIRNRYINHLDPKLIKTPFSKQEDITVLRLYKQYGNQWAYIARNVEGRNENQVRNRVLAMMKQKRKDPSSKHEKKSKQKPKCDFYVDYEHMNYGNGMPLMNSLSMHDLQFPSQMSLQQHMMSMYPHYDQMYNNMQVHPMHYQLEAEASQGLHRSNSCQVFPDQGWMQQNYHSTSNEMLMQTCTMSPSTFVQSNYFSWNNPQDLSCDGINVARTESFHESLTHLPVVFNNQNEDQFMTQN